MNSILGVLLHLQMRLQPDKTQKKIGDKEFSVFTAGRTFKKSEISATKSFPFLLLAA